MGLGITFSELWSNFVSQFIQLVLSRRLEWPDGTEIIEGTDVNKLFEMDISRVQNIETFMNTFQQINSLQEVIALEIHLEYNKDGNRESVVLETWFLKKLPTNFLDEQTEMAAQREFIVMLRSLYSLVLLLPTSKMLNTTKAHKQNMQIRCKLEYINKDFSNHTEDIQMEFDLDGGFVQNNFGKGHFVHAKVEFRKDLSDIIKYIESSITFKREENLFIENRSFEESFTGQKMLECDSGCSLGSEVDSDEELPYNLMSQILDSYNDFEDDEYDNVHVLNFNPDIKRGELILLSDLELVLPQIKIVNYDDRCSHLHKDQLVFDLVPYIAEDEPCSGEETSIREDKISTFDCENPLVRFLEDISQLPKQMGFKQDTLQSLREKLNKFSGYS
ncbi:autophagy protein ATG13 [Acrasis kona]|uniref:Autophagy protein ATG13 n=1 Tax=Acrasis kona TaxID=1008807 RepID=A0AAW2YZ00_9EUKA